MRENSFGVYIIDQNYQIVGYNDTAQKLYPQLKKGNHCYQCLMNLDSPCEECPVLNKTDESRTYFDPMHHSYRAADAVEVNLSETEKGYVLVFSTAREGEKLVKQLTNNEEGLRLLGVINVLGNDYSDIYSVDVKSGKMQSFRYSGKALGIKEALCQETSYEQAMEEYIDTNVISEDQGKLRFAQSLSKLCDQLKVLPQVTVHYRARVNGEIHYYYMKCARVGKEEIENLVIAFSNEDTDVKRNELESTIIPGSVSAKRKILVVEDNELNREILTELLSEKFDILTAENGEIGLKMLSEHYRELSAVLLDVYMPVCDGFEFLERIKDDVMLSSVPVFVTTGSNRQLDEEHCLELGAVDFISKPYKPKVVKARLNSVIKLRESAAALSAIEYDELTGLYTRQAFYHHAKTLINFRSDKKFHVLVADIHNFKLVNSIYGEKMGDQVLEYLAKVFSEHIGDGLTVFIHGAYNKVFVPVYNNEVGLAAVFNEGDVTVGNVKEAVVVFALFEPFAVVNNCGVIHGFLFELARIIVILNRRGRVLHKVRTVYDEVIGTAVGLQVERFLFISVDYCIAGNISAD